MKQKIKVILNGKPIVTEWGTNLSEIITSEKLCGGHGVCGKCKVIAKGKLSELTAAETRFLTENELSRGIRLACRTYAIGDCRLQTLSSVKESQIATHSVLPEFKLDPIFSDYGVAVDVGTTTLVARLYNIEGKVIAETSRLNPQSVWGADVVSRIEAAINGKAQLLSRAIRHALNEMITEFSAIIDISNIDAVVITGNTVMLSLFTEQSLEPFSRAPFDVKQLFGKTVAASKLSLSALQSDVPVYIPPCISAFVGADTICAILATELYKNNTAMLVDIGTNGEMVLWHNGKLTVCSTAAGPAFEGAGISVGMRAVNGAIDKVTLQNGRLIAHVVGNTEPIGICGSGLIDAVACLIQNGQVEQTGYLNSGKAPIVHNIALVQEDVRALQLAKSAIYAGVVTLVEDQQLNFADISSLLVAGGFGNYLNGESAAKIGLLPSELTAVTCTVGNAAIGGAAILLLDSTRKAVAQTVAQEAKVLNLSANSRFSENFMMGMLFGEQL